MLQQLSGDMCFVMFLEACPTALHTAVACLEQRSSTECPSHIEPHRGKQPCADTQQLCLFVTNHSQCIASQLGHHRSLSAHVGHVGHQILSLCSMQVVDRLPHLRHARHAAHRSHTRHGVVCNTTLWSNRGTTQLLHTRLAAAFTPANRRT